SPARIGAGAKTRCLDGGRRPPPECPHDELHVSFPYYSRLPVRFVLCVLNREQAAAAGAGRASTSGHAIVVAAVSDRRRMQKSLRVAHPPDRAIAIFAEEQCAVFGDSDSDRSTPHLTFWRDETGHEVFVLAACFTGRVIERDADDFVAGALGPIP